MNVLFVCSGNIGRSQMAMEYFKQLSNDKSASAGTRVTSEDERIGDRDDAQVVLQAMREDGIIMENNRRTAVTPAMLDNFDTVIVMAEPDRIPEWLSSSSKIEYWAITNVNGLPLDQVRTIRDTIKTKVTQLNNGMPQRTPRGVINHRVPGRRADYLYRLSLKSLVRNEAGDILVVKETGRDWWDLPGGGMDHGENIRAAIAREMKEEVNLNGHFTYKIIAVDEPAYLKPHDIWQVRLIFEVKPDSLVFSVGEDGDEVAFMNPAVFKDSESEVERRICRYANIAL